MTADFDVISAELEHRGAKGRVRERQAVDEFLSKYLPGSVRTAHGGEIVAVNGETSNECDVLIVDRDTPPLITERDYAVYPVECVYVVVEVKSKLNKRELIDAHAKLRRAKQLPKSAFQPQAGAIVRSTALYGREWDYFPLIGHILSYTSTNLTTLCRQLDELQRDDPFEHRIDTICVLGKGLIANWSEKSGAFVLASGPDTRLRAVASDNPLLIWAAQLQQIAANAWMPNFRLLDYVQGEVLGEALDGSGRPQR